LKGKAGKFIILNINEENETVKSGIKMEVHHHPHVEKKGFKIVGDLKYDTIPCRVNAETNILLLSGIRETN
jgi:hypothetical protein